MRKNRKKCVVYGYLSCNVGDDLFFEVLAKRYPKVDFYLFPPSTLLNTYIKMFKHINNIKFYDKNPEYIRLKKDIPDPKVVLNTFPLLCDKVKEADYFINLGGSIFIQNDNWENDDRRLLLELAHDKPSFIIGSNFGPYKDKAFLNFYHEWFQQFEDVCFRDKYSYQLFKDLNNTRVAHDIVLSTNRPKLSRIKKKTLGISVVDLEWRSDIKKYEQEYIDYMSKVVHMYISKGYKVTLYSFCKNEGDLKMIEKIMKCLDLYDQHKVKVFSYDGNLKKFKKDFSKNEYILGTRFHSIILSIVNGQWVLPIIYNEKTQHVLEELDKNIKTINVKQIGNKNILKDIECFQKINLLPTENTALNQFKILDQYMKFDDR